MDGLPHLSICTKNKKKELPAGHPTCTHTRHFLRVPRALTLWRISMDGFNHNGFSNRRMNTRKRERKNVYIYFPPIVLELIVTIFTILSSVVHSKKECLFSRQLYIYYKEYAHKTITHTHKGQWVHLVPLEVFQHGHWSTFDNSLLLYSISFYQTQYSFLFELHKESFSFKK